MRLLLLPTILTTPPLRPPRTFYYFSPCTVTTADLVDSINCAFGSCPSNCAQHKYVPPSLHLGLVMVRVRYISLMSPETLHPSLFISSWGRFIKYPFMIYAIYRLFPPWTGVLLIISASNLVTHAGGRHVTVRFCVA